MPRFLMFLTPWSFLVGLDRRLDCLENLMTNATDQLASANDKVDALTFQLTDFVNDVRQRLTTINADQLSPSAQANMDDLLRKTDALSVQLASADTEVSGDGSTPADPNQDAPAEDVPAEPAPRG